MISQRFPNSPCTEYVYALHIAAVFIDLKTFKWRNLIVSSVENLTFLYIIKVFKSKLRLRSDLNIYWVFYKNIHKL